MKHIGLTLLTWLVIGYLRLVFTTMRVELSGGKQWQALVESDAKILTLFWHGRLLVAPMMAKHHRQAKGMISRHGDGEFIAKVMQAFSLGSVRGSSNRAASDAKGAKNRGGSAALKGALHALQKNIIVGITPDGPKGPYHVMKPNIMPLAQLAEATIVLTCFSAKWALRFKSWDKFQLPLPFTKIRIDYSEPITITRKTNADSMLHKLQIKMIKQQETLDDWSNQK